MKKTQIILISILTIIFLCFFYFTENFVDQRTDIDYKLTECYKSRKITSTSNPKFKLDAYCINLKDRKKNMDFIHSEWDEYLNITRFIALPSATESHFQIIKNIFQNKDNIKFPIVIMEDDVYRKNNFIYKSII